MGEVQAERHPATPDGRYFVVRGRLWRKSNPGLSKKKQTRLVHELMQARRSVAAAQRIGNAAEEKKARLRVQVAKVALGERGPVWWTDGAEDYNQQMVATTPYADWFAGLSDK